MPSVRPNDRRSIPPGLVLAALLLASAAAASASESPFAALDGGLSEAELARASELLSEGDATLWAHPGASGLWLGLRTGPTAVVSLCLEVGGSIHVLHSSAALGAVVYRPTDQGWALEGSFDWQMRDTELTDEAIQARRGHFEQHGWVASTAGMGPAGEVEILLDPARFLDGETPFSFGIMPAEEPHEVFGLPATSAGECAAQKLVFGDPPAELDLDPRPWPLLPAIEETP